MKRVLGSIAFLTTALGLFWVWANPPKFFYSLDDSIVAFLSVNMFIPATIIIIVGSYKVIVHGWESSIQKLRTILPFFGWYYAALIGIVSANHLMANYEPSFLVQLGLFLSMLPVFLFIHEIVKILLKIVIGEKINEKI